MASTNPAGQVTDLHLLRSMTQGDAAAMSALYDRYAPGIMGLAMRITRETADAEEVVVDTFAQAWRDAGRFDTGRGSVAAWLATIARSRALDLMRSRARRTRLTDTASILPEADAAFAGSQPPSPMGALLADERTTLIRKALVALPPAQSRVLEMGYFEGLSQSEIAERLGEPLGTVKTRMRLALQKLRDLLAPLGPGVAQ